MWGNYISKIILPCIVLVCLITLPSGFSNATESDDRCILSEALVSENEPLKCRDRTNLKSWCSSAFRYSVLSIGYIGFLSSCYYVNTLLAKKPFPLFLFQATSGSLNLALGLSVIQPLVSKITYGTFKLTRNEKGVSTKDHQILIDQWQRTYEVYETNAQMSRNLHTRVMNYINIYFGNFSRLSENSKNKSIALFCCFFKMNLADVDPNMPFISNAIELGTNGYMPKKQVILDYLKNIDDSFCPEIYGKYINCWFGDLKIVIN